jgi:2'-5' RNA ligase
MKSIGSSIWLQPTGKTKLRFEKIIKELSRKFNAPVFQPHVTLLGDIINQEVMGKIERLSKVIKSFNIRLNKIDFLDEYFRCVFVRAVVSEELLNANSLARKLFNRQEDPEFMPHMSLLYGHYPIELKKNIISELTIDVEFPVEYLYLMDCSGEPAEWFLIKKYPLK